MQSGDRGVGAGAGVGAGRVYFPWVLEAAGVSAKQIDNDEDKGDIIVITVIIIIIIITVILCFYFSILVNFEPNEILLLNYVSSFNMYKTISVQVLLFFLFVTLLQLSKYSLSSNRSLHRSTYALCETFCSSLPCPL